MIIFGVVFCHQLSALTRNQSDLLSAWEDYLENNRSTVYLKPVSEMTYDFKTNLFPFEGTLKVLNVVVDEEGYGCEGYKTGYIETELVGVEDDFYEKHYYSLSIWQRNNTLYFDENQDKWVLYNELTLNYETCEAGFQPWAGIMGLASSLFPLAVIVVILIIVIVVTSVMQKKNRSYMDFAEKATKRSLEIAEKSLALNEESNELLKNIADELKKQVN